MSVEVGSRQTIGMSFAGHFRQDPQVALAQVAGRLHVALGQRDHAAPDLARRNEDLDAVVPEHGDRGLGQERIEIVGEHVHKQGDARPVGLRAGCVQPRFWASFRNGTVRSSAAGGATIGRTPCR